MNEAIPFNNYGNYLRKRYGNRAYRIGIDGGFGCPNRKGGRSSAGCSYCDVIGSRAPYLDTVESIRGQIDRTAAFLKKRYRAEVFLLYFQAYTSTLGKVTDLQRQYDNALEMLPFRELIVSTRPDCIDSERADLLASYKDRGLDVWVELGLQTHRGETLERINRGHSVEDFLQAFYLLRGRGVKVAVHLIFGLPGEGIDAVRESAEFISRLKPEGLKLHNLHVPEGAPLFQEYLAGELSLPCQQRHIDYLRCFLERIPKEIIIMRLTCDTPRERSGLPKGFSQKSYFYELFYREMRTHRSFQGKYFDKKT